VIGLDTNILVRFLAQDNPVQSPIASRFMKSLTADEPGWVSLSTFLELAWVLGSKGRVDRRTMLNALEKLLSLDEVIVDQAEILENALQVYRQGNADFTDCLIAASGRSAGCSRTVTFDRIAARGAGMELLD